MGVKKRVACLYRVSTKMQLSADDDLPVQRNACLEFIRKRPDWEFCREYLEKGVSGYKKSLAKRDVLQQVRADAEAHLFDVLLVFLFDRVGRIESESPFVVRWFVEHGIEVWSVKEGQQKFDSHTDSLTNFIRFWQAEGESIKTSLRVDEALKQKTRAGEYGGGRAPFGYERVPTGEITKKGRAVTALRKNPEQVKIVRLIYDLSIQKGYGGRRIARYLNGKGCPAQKGGQWNACSVNYILRNPIYKGYPAYGKTSGKSGTQKRMSPDQWILSDRQVDALTVVPEEEWNTVQRIRNRTEVGQNRRRENNLKLDHHQLNKSPLLLIGLIRCGVCGSAMGTGYSSSKWVTKDGNVHRTCKAVYQCVGRTSGHTGCTAKVSHQAEPIEGTVLEEIKKYINTLPSLDLTEKIEQLQRQKLSEDGKVLRHLTREKHTAEKTIAALKVQIVKSLNNEADFDRKLLNGLMRENTEKLNSVNWQLQETQKTIQRKKTESIHPESFQKLVPNWREEFEEAPFEVKKVLLSGLIDEVRIKPDTILVRLKIDLKSFLTGTEKNQKRDGNACHSAVSAVVKAPVK